MKKNIIALCIMFLILPVLVFFSLSTNLGNEKNNLINEENKLVNLTVIEDDISDDYIYKISSESSIYSLSKYDKLNSSYNSIASNTSLQDLINQAKSSSSNNQFSIIFDDISTSQEIKFNNIFNITLYGTITENRNEDTNTIKFEYCNNVSSYLNITNSLKIQNVSSTVDFKGGNIFLKDLGTINNSGSLTITNCNIISNTNVITNNNNLIINGGVIESTAGITISNVNKGQIDVNGGEVKSGNIAISSQTNNEINITGGKISSTAQTTIVITHHNNNSQYAIHMTGGEIENVSGNSIVVNSNGIVLLEGGIINGNVSAPNESTKIYLKGNIKINGFIITAPSIIYAQDFDKLNNNTYKIIYNNDENYSNMKINNASGLSSYFEYEDNRYVFVDDGYDLLLKKAIKIIFNINEFDNSIYMPLGDAIKKPVDPIYEGYVFTGWYVDGMLWDFETKTNVTRTLTAQFVKKIDTFEITQEEEAFNLKGHTEDNDVTYDIDVSSIQDLSDIFDEINLKKETDYCTVILNSIVILNDLEIVYDFTFIGEIIYEFTSTDEIIIEDEENKVDITISSEASFNLTLDESINILVKDNSTLKIIGGNYSSLFENNGTLIISSGVINSSIKSNNFLIISGGIINSDIINQGSLELKGYPQIEGIIKTNNLIVNDLITDNIFKIELESFNVDNVIVTNGHLNLINFDLVNEGYGLTVVGNDLVVREQFTVSFVCIDETFTTFYDYVIKEQFLVKPENPMREGYFFVNWLNSSDKSIWEFENKPVTSDITLEVSWIENVNDYKIIHDGPKFSAYGKDDEGYNYFLGESETIQDVINIIKTFAFTKNFSIYFDNLNLGNQNIVLENIEGNVYLEGSLTAQVTQQNLGIIVVRNSSVYFNLNITNEDNASSIYSEHIDTEIYITGGTYTSAFSYIVHSADRGRIYVSGGEFTSTGFYECFYILYGTLNISGGTINIQSGSSITTKKGNVYITGGDINNVDGNTISCISDESSEMITVSITGGVIENKNGNAFYATGYANVTIGGDAIIKGSVEFRDIHESITVVLTLTEAPSITNDIKIDIKKIKAENLTTTNKFSLDITNLNENMIDEVVVYNGTSFLENFLITNQEYGLTGVGDDLVIRLLRKVTLDFGSTTKDIFVVDRTNMIRPEDPTKIDSFFTGFYYENRLWNFEEEEITEDITLNVIWADKTFYYDLEYENSLYLLTGYTNIIDYTYINSFSNILDCLDFLNNKNKELTINFKNITLETITFEFDKTITLEGNLIINELTLNSNINSYLKFNSGKIINNQTLKIYSNEINSEILNDKTLEIHGGKITGLITSSNLVNIYSGEINKIVNNNTLNISGGIINIITNNNTLNITDGEIDFVENNGNTTISGGEIKTSITTNDEKKLTLKNDALITGIIYMYANTLEVNGIVNNFVVSVLDINSENELDIILNASSYLDNFTYLNDEYKFFVNGSNLKIKKQYRVTFNVDSEDSGLDIIKYCIFGEKIKNITNLTKEGYVFYDWYYNNSSFDFETIISSNITLNAIWALKTYQYDIIDNGSSFECFGETDIENFTYSLGVDSINFLLDLINQDKLNSIQTINFNSIVTTEEVEFNYEFIISGDLSSSKIIINKTITNNANLSSSIYVNNTLIVSLNTISGDIYLASDSLLRINNDFDLDGCIYVSENSLEINSTLVNEYKVKLLDETKNILTLINKPLIDNFTYNDSTFRIVCEENSLIIKKVFIVTFDNNGSLPFINSCEVLYNDLVNQVEEVMKLGYSFKGWYNLDTLWDFETFKVTQNITLTAFWALKNYDYEITSTDEVYKVIGKAEDITYVLIEDNLISNVIEQIRIDSNKNNLSITFNNIITKETIEFKNEWGYIDLRGNITNNTSLIVFDLSGDVIVNSYINITASNKAYVTKGSSKLIIEEGDITSFDVSIVHDSTGGLTIKGGSISSVSANQSLFLDGDFEITGKLSAVVGVIILVSITNQLNVEIKNPQSELVVASGGVSYIDLVVLENTDYSLVIINNNICLKSVFTITFDVDGNITTTTVLYREYITNTPEVSKEHYIFDGWYYGEVKLDLTTYEVYFDLRLQARYKIASPTLLDITSNISKEFDPLSEINIFIQLSEVSGFKYTYNYYFNEQAFNPNTLIKYTSQTGVYKIIVTVTDNLQIAIFEYLINIDIYKKQIQVETPIFNTTLKYLDPLPQTDSIYGTYNLKDGQTLIAGVNDYEWEFTPFDTLNYEYDVFTGIISLSVLKEVGFGSVSISDIDYRETPNPSVNTSSEYDVLYLYYYDDDWFEEKPVNAGVYFVKAILFNSSNYEDYETEAVEFRINKIYGDGVNIYANNVTYQDDLDYGIKNINYECDINFKFREKNSAIWKDEEPTEAGEYYVKGFITNALNFLDSETIEVYFVISKKVGLGEIEVGASSYLENLNIKTSTQINYSNTLLYFSIDNLEFTNTYPTNAGSYYVYAVFSGARNYLDYKTEVKEFKILKLSGSGYIDDCVFNYLDEVLLNVVTDGSDFDITYYFSTNALDFNTTLPIDAGVYYVYATLRNSSNYEDFDTEIKQFEILKIDGNGTFKIDSVNYLESLNIIVDSTIPDYNYEVYYSLDKLTYTKVLPTDCNTYYAYALLTYPKNYFDFKTEVISFTINKIDGSGSLITKDFDYQEKLIFDIDSVVTDYSMKLFYSLDNITFEEKVPTDCNTYFVYALLYNSNNYNDYETEVISFNINKIDVISKINEANFDYQEELRFSIDSVVSDYSYEYFYSIDNINFDTTLPVDAGVYFVYCKLTSSVNYNDFITPVISFRINKIDVITKIINTDFVYNQELIFSLDSVVSDYTIKYFYSSDNITFTETVPVEVGVYYVYLELTSSLNYNDFVTEVISFEIKKANGSGEVVSKDFIYLETINLTVNADKSYSKEFYYSSDNKNFNTTVPVDAGVYYVYALLHSSNKYLDYQTETVTFEILKIEGRATIIAGNSKYLEKLNISLNSLVTDYEVTYLYSSDNLNFNTKAPVNAGSYFVKAELKNSKNHLDWVTESVHFEILKKEQDSISLKEQNTLFYGDGTISLTITGGNGTGRLIFELLSGDALLSSNILTVKTAGELRIRVTKESDNNYLGITTEFDVIVQKRVLVITPLPTTKHYGQIDPVIDYIISSGSLVNGDSFKGSLSRISGESIGSYEIIKGTLEVNSNYTIILNKANFTILAKEVNINFVNGVGYHFYDYEKTVITQGDNITFRLKIEDNYNNSTPIVTVKYSDGAVQVLTSIDGLYTLYNVLDNIDLTVTNVTLNRYVVSFDDNIVAYVNGVSINSGSKVLLGSKVVFSASLSDFMKIVSWKVNESILNSSSSWYIINNLDQDYSLEINTESITNIEVSKELTVSGVVYDFLDRTLSNALVIAMQGNIFYGSCITNESGEYIIDFLPNLKLNLIVIYENTTFNSLINFNGNNIIHNIKLPSISTNIEFRNEFNNVSVGGFENVLFDEEFINLLNDGVNSGSKISLNIIIEDNIFEFDTKKIVGYTFDITINNVITYNETVTTNTISKLTKLITIAIRLNEESIGMANYEVYRLHDGEIQILTTKPNEDGEYIELSSDGLFLLIHTKSFSKYGICFETPRITPIKPKFMWGWFISGVVLGSLISFGAYYVIFDKKLLVKKES